MTFHEAHKILTDHNNWRRSVGIYKDETRKQAYSTSQVGQAIETALKALLLCMGVNED